MRHCHTPRRRALLRATLACLVALVSIARGQGQTQPRSAPAQDEEVVRVNAELVQTDVMVFDKQGRFVDNLLREQFELKVDGKLMPVSFFERVTAGTFDEEAQLAAARGGAHLTAKDAATRPLDRGRIVVFFIDDLHLSFDSLNRTRRMLSQFIENELGQNDQVAVASTSGQIGFLQQFTDNKAVLRAAVARLKTLPNLVRDTESPPMTEYMALSIANREDPGVFGYFMAQCMSRNGKDYPPSACALEVRSRAHAIVAAATPVTRDTLSALESLMRSSAQLTGRKLVFFVSDGFFVDNKSSNVSDRIQRVTDAALRAGVVIYTIDARGLFNNMLDATGVVPLDPNGRLEMANMREIPASQDALNALAEDTGGRALRNTNNVDPFVAKTLKETSRYYLLAWRPESEEQRQGRFRRVEVSVKGRPDLSVRLSRGFIETQAKRATTMPAGRETTAKTRTALTDLRDATAAAQPRGSLPVMLDLSYIDTPAHGTVLTASVQVAVEARDFAVTNERATAFDVAGVVRDAQGKISSDFKTRLNVSAPDAADDKGDKGDTGAERSTVIYNYRAPLAPGLYQVRVAARDSRSGQMGSAMQWVEVPDIKSHALALSSLLVGLQDVHAASDAPQNAPTPAAPQVQFSVDHRFARGSRLRFLTVIYNALATRGATVGNADAAPDLTLQVQIFHDDQPVVTTPARKVSTEGIADLSRLPYEAEISLGALPSGRYVLQVSVLDRRAKQSATQRTRFEIE
jgi:VWFA-related protein